MKSIYSATDHITVISRHNTPDKHKHYMKHIIISLEDSIHFLINNSTITAKGVIINSNVPHTLDFTSKKHIIFLFDETSDIAEEINDIFLKDKDYYKLGDNIINAIQTSSLSSHNLNDYAEYKKEYNNLLNLLGLTSNIQNSYDERISNLIYWLKTQEGIYEDIMKQILNLTHLSQSRLSHLFKSEMKVSLSSYLVLIKTIKTYKYILAGYNITDASLKAGFYSSSHFSSTFKNMTGFSPSSLIKDTQYFKTFL